MNKLATLGLVSLIGLASCREKPPELEPYDDGVSNYNKEVPVLSYVIQENETVSSILEAELANLVMILHLKKVFIIKILVLLIMTLGIFIDHNKKIMVRVK